MSALIRLSLLLVVVPMLELALLLTIADLTSFTATVALVIGSGIAGVWLLRWQGTRTLRAIRQELSHGRIPQRELLDGTLLLVAGALLLTPGVLTDLLGLLLLFPLTRTFFRGWLVALVTTRIHRGNAGRSAETPPKQSEVIDSYVVTRSNDPDESAG